MEFAPVVDMEGIGNAENGPFDLEPHANKPIILRRYSVLEAECDL
jgi:hypothetical protein